MSKTREQKTNMFDQLFITNTIQSIIINGLPAIRINQAEIPHIRFLGDEKLIDYINFDTVDNCLIIAADGNLSEISNEDFELFISIDKLNLLKLQNVGNAKIEIACLNVASIGLEAKSIGLLHCILCSDHAKIQLNSVGTFVTEGSADLSSIKYSAIGDFQTVENEH